MDISPLGIARTFVTELPLLIFSAIVLLVGKCSNATHRDTLTEIITLLARPVLRTPAPLLKSQQAFSYDYGIWGRIWVSKWTVPVDSGIDSDETGTENVLPEEVKQGQKAMQKGKPLEQAVAYAIRELDDQLAVVDEKHNAHMRLVPRPSAVETEWTAYRAKVSHLAGRPPLSEQEMYASMMEEIDPSGPTILYFHGGAHCLMDPITHRWTTSKLAKECGGRVLSVRYRLSPQHIFPAALLDAFSVYLALIAPPSEAFHEAVPASKIVIAGDSSGAGLAASLLLLLQTLSNHQYRIAFHRRSLTIPNPVCAGVTLVSPWLDITRSLPSTRINARWDIIAPPPPEKTNPTPAFPPDKIWPASPPRVETYCSALMCTHPLVSPVAAQPHHWDGVPPVYICVGWEGMQDEAEILARRIFDADPTRQVVIFDGYEGMPHCFAMFPWNWAGVTAMSRWAKFCKNVVHRESIAWRDIATWTNSKTKEAQEVKLNDLGLTSIGCWYARDPLTDQVVDQKLAEGRRWRLELDQQMVQRWEAELKPEQA